MACPADHYARV